LSLFNSYVPTYLQYIRTYAEGSRYVGSLTKKDSQYWLVEGAELSISTTSIPTYVYLIR